MTKTRRDAAVQDVAVLETVRTRFEGNMHRHAGIEWKEVAARLVAQPERLRALAEMEGTGGEPDVVGIDAQTGAIMIVDCAPESPAGRRSLCYDREARVTRKENAPQGSALEMAAAMGISLLTEEQYRALQMLGTFDMKTSSWIETPDAIRSLGGALFCDCRYDHVFTYHNGAASYYAARGFRGLLLLDATIDHSRHGVGAS